MEDLQRVALADFHFQLIMSGQMPCEYRGINLLGEEEMTIVPRLTACFYVSEEAEHSLDMIWITFGESGEQFVRCELGVVSRFKIAGERIREQSGTQLLALPDLLQADEGDPAEVRKLLRERKLPFAAVLIGRSMPEMDCAAFLWQLPFLESTSVLEKVAGRMSAYLA